MSQTASAPVSRKTRGPSTAKTENTRLSVMQAALQEFMAQGFANAKISNISRNAGVAKGSIYNYFPDKETLFEGVLTAFISTAKLEMQAHERQPGESVKMFLKRVLLPVIAGIETTGRAQIARLIMSEGARFPDLAAAYVREVHQPLLDTVTDLINIARAEGELKDERLAAFPCLLLAPNWFGMVHNGMLNPAAPLDIGALFEAGIDIFFK